MTDELWLDVLGLTAKVTLSDDALASEVRRAWTACLLGGTRDTADFSVERIGTPVVEVRGDSRASKPQETLDAELEQLTQTLTVTAIEQLAGQRLMLHACAVAEGDRNAIFVGPSGMGKTTVARTLGQRWDYVTDECVAVDPAGLVAPFPKPLSIVTDGLVKHQAAPRELGLTSVRHPTRPAGLFLLRRDPAAGTPRSEQVRTVEAVALLAEHASYLAHLDGPLRQLADLVHCAGGLTVITYSEAAHLTPLVEGSLARSA